MPFWPGMCSPPRPHHIARLASGLNVPSHAQVTVFHQEWSRFRTKGHAHLELTLDAADFASLIAQATDLDYRDLSTDSTAVQLARQHLLMEGRGLYRLEGNVQRGEFTFVVLDAARRRLGVFFMES
jgi:predicted nucleotide-binding protein